MTLFRNRTAITAALSLAALGATPATASAEVERPSQAEASKGLFLSYAPKPDADGAVCLVDSGIDENRDTEHAIIERPRWRATAARARTATPTSATAR
ncbi:MAG: hypothetical protein ACR2ML_14420 [Solirubrobacteraceae bacterium]